MWITAGAVMKVESGYSPDFAVGPAMYYAVAIIEILLALAIVIGGCARRLGLWAVLAMCLAGAVWTRLLADKPCGCMGSRAILSNSMHASLSCLLGVAGVAALTIQSERSLRVSSG
jgi:hypothetical protein